MTVILVLSTFIVFLLIDHFFSKRPAVQIALQPAVARESALRLEPSLVGGFKVPENLRYHPGHTWALSESPSLVRVGVDDFATKLMGKVERLSLPQRGQWIRQGQKLASIYRGGAEVDMLSPIEGSVADINEALAQKPELARQDPYGKGGW
jgi:glycine cleavage system H lipoate-binding protein